MLFYLANMPKDGQQRIQLSIDGHSYHTTVLSMSKQDAQILAINLLKFVADPIKQGEEF